MNNLSYQLLYENIMNNVSKIIKKQLSETYGIQDFDNVEYTKELETISSDILNHFDNVIYDCTLYQNNKPIVLLQKLKYEIKSLDWLDKIDVYITNKSIIENNNDVFLLYHNNCYLFNENKIIPIKYKLNIFNKNEIITEPFIFYNNKIKQATLIISVPNKKLLFNKSELTSILKHEISHIYDVYKQNISFNKLNNDLLELSSDIIYNDNKTNDIIDKLLNEKNNVNTLKHLINTEVSYDVISNFIADNLYLLNKSELRARLNNCRYEIEQFINNKNIILNIKNNDILQDKLRLISSTFNTYFILYEILKMFIKYLSNDIKQQFIDNDIKNVYDKLRPNDYNYKKIFNKKLTNNYNQYTLKSFDLFIQYHVDNIYNIFLKHAISIFGNYVFDDDIFDYKKSLKGLIR